MDTEISALGRFQCKGDYWRGCLAGVSVPEPDHPAAEGSAVGHQAGEEQGIRLILGDVNARRYEHRHFSTWEIPTLGRFHRQGIYGGVALLRRFQDSNTRKILT